MLEFILASFFVAQGFRDWRQPTVGELNSFLLQIVFQCWALTTACAKPHQPGSCGDSFPKSLSWFKAAGLATDERKPVGTRSNATPARFGGVLCEPPEPEYELFH